LPAQPTFGLSLALLGLGRTHGGFAYAQRVGRFGIAAGIQSFSGGSFTGRNVRGDPIGTYVPQDIAVVLGGAVRWEFFSVGIAGKYLWSGLLGGGLSGTGAALDVGALFHVADLFSVGASLSNIGGFMVWEGNREVVPPMFAVGVATEIGLAPPMVRERNPLTGEESVRWLPASRYLLLSVETRYRLGAARPSVVCAAELAPLPGAALRGGVTLFGDETGRAGWLLRQRLGGGIAVQLPQPLELPIALQLDYALTYEYSAPSSLAHTLGLTAQLLP
jgi:hypothetical protein